MSKKRTHEEFLEVLAEKNEHYSKGDFSSGVDCNLAIGEV